jgi:hypothetical protein
MHGVLEEYGLVFVSSYFSSSPSSSAHWKDLQDEMRNFAGVEEAHFYRRYDHGGVSDSLWGFIYDTRLSSGTVSRSLLLWAIIWPHCAATLGLLTTISAPRRHMLACQRDRPVWFMAGKATSANHSMSLYLLVLLLFVSRAES